MSFGFSVSDVGNLVKLAWTTVQNTRNASSEHDELSCAALGLHNALRRLEIEARDQKSPLNRPEDASRREIEAVASGCGKVLNALDKILERWKGLNSEGKGLPKMWQKFRFGTEEMTLKDLRVKMTFYTSALSLHLNMVSVGSAGRVETQMEAAGGDLKELKSAVNTITAHLMSNAREEGSQMTAYADDDRAVWREFRRGLVKQGFRSSLLHKHKATIQAYVNELGSRGIMDEQEISEEMSGSDPIEANPGNVAKKRVLEPRNVQAATPYEDQIGLERNPGSDDSAINQQFSALNTSASSVYVAPSQSPPSLACIQARRGSISFTPDRSKVFPEVVIPLLKDDENTPRDAGKTVCDSKPRLYAEADLSGQGETALDSQSAYGHYSHASGLWSDQTREGWKEWMENGLANQRRQWMERRLHYSIGSWHHILSSPRSGFVAAPWGICWVYNGIDASILLANFEILVKVLHLAAPDEESCDFYYLQVINVLQAEARKLVCQLSAAVIYEDSVATDWIASELHRDPGVSSAGTACVWFLSKAWRFISSDRCDSILKAISNWTMNVDARNQWKPELRDVLDSGITAATIENNLDSFEYENDYGGSYDLLDLQLDKLFELEWRLSNKANYLYPSRYHREGQDWYYGTTRISDLQCYCQHSLSIIDKWPRFPNTGLLMALKERFQEKPSAYLDQLEIIPAAALSKAQASTNNTSKDTDRPGREAAGTGSNET